MAHAEPRPAALHPDRLLPAEPGVRAIARRLYDAVRDLPILSPHGHVDARLLLDDVPFPDPATLLVTPDHYVTRLLHAGGVPLDELGVGQRRARPRRSPAQVWRRLCAHWHVFRGTPVAVLARAELAEIFDVDRAAVGADRGRDLRPGRRAARQGRLPARARCSSGSASRCWPRPTTRATTSPRTPPWPPTRPGRPGAPDLPARPVPGGGARRLAGRGGAARRGQRRRHRRLRRLGRAAMEDRRALLPRARRDLGRPQPRGRRHRAARAPPRRSAIYRAALAGTATAAEAVALRRHMLLEMARMSCDDGLVMTLHPGVRRNHHGPTSRRFGADTGHDIPLRGDFTDPLRPLLERYGTHPEPAPRAVHARRDGVLARARAAGRLLPVGLRGRAVVVPRRSRGRPALPARRHRDGRLLPDVGVHRRHPRVLLDPRPPRHVPPPRRRLPRPSWSPSTSSTRTRRSRRRSTWSAGRPREVFKL